jgi:hypothetical protein
MRERVVICFVFIFFSSTSLFAQNDSPSVVQPTYQPSYIIRDSTELARYFAEQDSIQGVKDSLKAIGDSLSMAWIRPPDPNRPNRFLDSLVEHYRIKNLDFAAWKKQFPAKVYRYDQGRLKPKGEVWLFYFVIFLLIFFAVLKKSFSKELNVIFHSIYSNRVLNQVNKEDRLFSSWPFLFLYILFAFTVGTFIYLCTSYFHLSYSITGFQWLLTLSLIVLGLFTLKIIVLRLLGFVLNLQKAFKNYVSILYLSYFNAAILFLPLVVAFSLSPLRFAEIYIYLGILLTGAIFTLQFIRAGALILSEYRFPIVYLVLYICALEICPLAILIKVLRF